MIGVRSGGEPFPHPGREVLTRVTACVGTRAKHLPPPNSYPDMNFITVNV
jgi:hypothetical protein